MLLRGNAPLPEPVEYNCPLCPPENIEGAYYLRMDVSDTPGVLSRISSVTAKYKVSIASVQQRAGARPGAASLILTTHRSNEKAIRAAVKTLRQLSAVLSPPLLLRIASFDD